MEIEKKYKTKKVSGEDAKLLIQFLINAFDDYLGARMLLINDLLPQGCILATTAIEKYFKALLISHGIKPPNHHNISANAFKNSIENKYKKIHDLINWEFISFLSNSYRLRYLDDLKNEYSIAIIQSKTLAELDFTVSSIEENFIVLNAQKEEKKNKFRHLREIKDPKLIQDNYYLNEINKTTFIKAKNSVYEFRKMINGEIFQVQYVSENIVNDGKFLYDALKPQEENPSQNFKYLF